MPNDRFQNSANSLEGPIRNTRALTPALGTFEPTKAIIASVPGLLTARFVDDAADVTVTLNAGVRYDFRLIAVTSFVSSPGYGAADWFSAGTMSVGLGPAVIGLY